jgi:hypothetical protein
MMCVRTRCRVTLNALSIVLVGRIPRHFAEPYPFVILADGGQDKAGSKGRAVHEERSRSQGILQQTM